MPDCATPGVRELLANTERSRWPLAKEAQLLLATAGGPDQDARIRALASHPLNWVLFLQLTALERAESVVAGRFSRLGITLPKEIGSQLKAMALRSDLRMTMVSHRLDRTLEALAAQQIPALLLKGAALGRTVYGSLARRPMLDIDLLVQPEQAAAARAVALQAGWVPQNLERANDQYAGHFHLPPLSDGIGLSFNLELHTALFLTGHPFSWPLEELWARSQPLADSIARIPAMEDTLLHTLLHFSWSHMGKVGPWRAFRDLHALAASGTVNWTKFTDLAQRTGGAPAAYWTLRLARVFGVTDVPAEVEAALRPQMSEAVARILERHFAGQWYLLDGPCPSLRLERFLWQVGMGPLGRGANRSTPWARESLFPQLWEAPVPESTSGRLGRHLASVGSYAKYFRRVVLGRMPEQLSQSGAQP